MNRGGVTVGLLLFSLTLVACGEDGGGGPPCASLRFDGDDRVAIDKAAFDLGASFTLAAWVKLESGSQAALIDTGRSGSYCGPFGLQVGQFGQLVLTIRGGEGNLKCEPKVTLSADSPLPVGQWIHVAATTDGATASLFAAAAGSKSAKVKAVDPYKPIHDVWFGSEDGPNLGVKGNMANVAIWNRALTYQEVSAAMNRLPADRSGLLGYWMLNEGEGSVARDLSGKGHHGRISGAGWDTEGPHCEANQIF